MPITASDEIARVENELKGIRADIQALQAGGKLI
jgi:hypothetical protein